MQKFTNVKALALGAMMVFGTTAAFGQAEPQNDWETVKFPKPTENVKPILYSNVEGVDAVLPGFPGNSLGKGVYVRTIKEGTTLYYPNATEKPTSNYTTTTVWTAEDSLGVFLGDKMAGQVLFDLSTMYLRDIQNFTLNLSAETFGLTATSEAIWNIAIRVYKLDGTPATFADLLENGDTNPAEFKKEGIFNTAKDAPKTINLFKVVSDDVTDVYEQLLDESLSNKLIQIELWSNEVEIKDVNNATTTSHFAPALVVSGFNMEFAQPSIALDVDRTAFDAGMGFTSCETGELTLIMNNLYFIESAKVANHFVFTDAATPIAAPDFADVKLADAKKNEDTGCRELKDSYVFAPTAIGTYSGKFGVKLENSYGSYQTLNPLRLQAESEVVSGNSIPELKLADNHIFFSQTCQHIDVTVSGKNIPNPRYSEVDFIAYEKKTTDNLNQWLPYGAIKVEEHFELSDCGVIIGEHTQVPHLSLNLLEWTNDITRLEAWKIAINNDYLVENALGTGKNYDAVEVYPYDYAVATAKVGALWLTYEGENFDGTESRHTADNVFFAPYNANDPLDNARYASRVKEYKLHASELKATEKDGQTAVIKLFLDNMTFYNQNNTDDQEFRFKLAEADAWTNNNTDTLSIEINTLDPAVMKSLREEGLSIFVQFVPNKDGYHVESNEMITWTPDTYQLQAWVNDEAWFDEVEEADGELCLFCGLTSVVANLYGDTRANLWSNLNDVKAIHEMNNSWRPVWGLKFPALVYPEFQKYYGNAYQDDCNAVNPLAVDSFYVAGYNLEKTVDITKKVNEKYSVEADKSYKYENAFSYVVKDMLNGGAVVADNKLTPNQYGEVLGLVVVTFDAADAKIPGCHIAEDSVIVKSNESVIRWTTPGLTPFSPFYYAQYDEAAEVMGNIWKPYITINYPSNEDGKIEAAVDAKTTVPVTIEGYEFNPLNVTTVEIARSFTESDNMFTLSKAKDVTINSFGRFTAVDDIIVQPNAVNACADENVLLVEAGCITLDTLIVAKPTTGDAVPTLDAMVHGDINGSTANLRWAPVPGADYYVVRVGHLAPINTSKNVFISEVFAKDNGTDNTDFLAVELFNGTGKVINPKMLVNYYLEVSQYNKTTKKTNKYYGHFKNTDINIINLEGGWNSTAVIINEFVNATGEDETVGTPVYLEISDNFKYDVRLMEGMNQIDIFSFGEAGAHLARVSQNGLAENADKFEISAWETINTSISSANATAYYMWEDESNVQFSVADGAESAQINANAESNYTKDGKLLKAQVINLKPNTLYDVQVVAYHPCLYKNGKSYLAQDFITTSEHVVATGEVEILIGKEGSATSNEEIAAAGVTVIAGNGNITIAGAAGKKVVIANILGQTVANTIIASDNATIAAPAGVVVVKVEGEAAVKAIVK